MRCGPRGDWDWKCQTDILFSSLQVFDPEDHASLHSDKFKEGLSIYGVSQSVIEASIVQPDCRDLEQHSDDLGAQSPP